MNQVIENIKNRRTTRAYKEEQIKEEELNQIIEAGIWSPSGHNRQPWHFTVIQNQDLIKEINEDSKEAVKKSDNVIEDIKKIVSSEKFNCFYNAPTLIIVSYGEEGLTSIMDISAATQNMLLAAESLGVGGCWNGIVRDAFQNEDLSKKYNEKLNIPKGNKVSHAIVLGYPKVKTLKGPKRKENAVTYIK